MKKYVALLLVFVILLFAACSPAQSPESEPTTSTTAATDPSGTDVLTEPSEPNATEPSEPSKEATQPSTNPPSEPSDPTVEPTEPPTDPSEPSEPTEPTIKPTEPTKPTQPTEPTEPTTKPTEPTEPTKPTKPTQPSEPTTKPTAPGGNSSTGGGTDDKEKPSQPTEPTTKPTEPTKPTQPTEPTTKPTVPSEPSTDDNDDTDIIEKPSQPTEPSEKPIEKPTEPSEPKPSLTINTPDNTIMFVGETMKLEYTYKGSGKLTFESWDTSRLTIDSNGKMKAISEGIVGVAVTDGNLYKFIDILVKSPEDKATSIKMTNMQGPLFDGVNKYVGDYMSFRACSKPDENPIKVSTSNASVVSVDSKIVNTFYSEITLTYKAAGSAVITLTSEDGCVVQKYTINVKAEYDCYPGKEKLTPQEFADACTQVMVENGFKKNTGCTSYRVLTLSPNKLTWTKAKGCAQGYVSSWYPNGKRQCWISYEGTDANGNYIFYTRWG